MFNFDTSYASLGEAFFKYALPTPVQKPQVLLYNESLAKDLSLPLAYQVSKAQMDQEQLQFIAAQLSGNRIADNTQPMAQAYAGHQFGYFTMLGDGRAILLGEHIAAHHSRIDVQLKGAGATPYSRRGDGRATLRAMLREYLISEAMHGLGIPTSRSLAVVTTGEKVFREEIQEGAVLTRIMKSHIRVGSFEYVRHYLTTDDLLTYTKYALNRHYPKEADSETPALALLKAVLVQQVHLIVQWMRVGFIHGVMNTDNMSIAGETFDYGPCAFINGYDPAKVFSSIDTNGRYAFGNQPGIAHWNLSCLANALLPIIDDDADQAVAKAKEVLDLFPSLYTQAYTEMMAAKIGFNAAICSNEVVDLIKSLLNWMKTESADYTNTFLQIQQALVQDDNHPSAFFQDWLKQRANLLNQYGISISQAQQLMETQNPLVIPRNHLVESVLDQVVLAGNLDGFNAFLSILQSPYLMHKGIAPYQAPPPNGDGFYATYCGT